MPLCCAIFLVYWLNYFLYFADFYFLLEMSDITYYMSKIIRSWHMLANRVI